MVAIDMTLEISLFIRNPAWKRLAETQASAIAQKRARGI